MATRQLKIKGNKASELVTSEILINGVQVFSGEIGVGLSPIGLSSQPAQSPDLIIVEYDGAETQETITVEIRIIEGTAFIGPMFSAVHNLNTNETDWLNQSSDNIDSGDGRTNIKIDDAAPAWPTDPAIVSPGGTPEHPAWTGYCFIVTADSTLTCDFTTWDAVIPLIDNEPPL